MALTKIPANLLDKSAHVDFADNEKLRIGTDNDLQIYYDGTNNLIQGSAGNVLYIQAKAGENSILAIPDGAVTLYHNNSLKFETTSTGASVTGNLAVSGNLTVSGTTTEISTTNLQVEDKNIVLNYGSGDTSSNADGAGITIQDAVDASNDASITWTASNDRFNFSHTAQINHDGVSLVMDGTSNASRTLLFRSVGTGEGIVKADGNMHILQEDASKYMRFSTANTERLRIDSSGDLNIVNTSQASLNYTTDGSLDYARIQGGKYGSGVGDLRFFTYSGGLGERMRIDRLGNVGIGYTTPYSKLWVEKEGINLDDFSFEDASSIAHLTLAGSNAHVRMHLGTMDVSPYGVYIQGGYDNTPDASGTGNSGTEPLSLNPLGGNVGIGTTNPTEKLMVNGALAVTGSLIDDRTATGTMDYASGSVRLVAYGSSSSAAGDMQFRTANGGASSTLKARISGDGFTNTSTTAKPAFRTEGAYGGGIGIDDGGSEGGWFSQDNGDTIHHYVARGSGDSAASKIVLTTRATGHVGIMHGGSNAVNHPLHVTREEAGYQVKFDNDNGSAQGLAIRIKANDAGNFNVLNAVSASSGSDETVLNVRDDGIVTTPRQCYFLAYRTSNLNPYNFTATSGATTQIFTHVSSSQSSAAGVAAFSTSDGTFSAPVDGLYLFHFSFYSNITIEQAWLTQNGARISYTDVTANTNASYTSGIFSSSIQYYMTAGQSIRIHPYSATGNNDYIYDNIYHTYWKGVLLG